MEKNVNRPFIGCIWNVKGDIITQFPNRRQRRAHLNMLPNSTKVGARRGHTPNPPLRSMDQIMWEQYGKHAKKIREQEAKKAEKAAKKLEKELNIKL